MAATGLIGALATIPDGTRSTTVATEANSNRWTSPRRMGAPYVRTTTCHRNDTSNREQDFLDPASARLRVALPDPREGGSTAPPRPEPGTTVHRQVIRTPVPAGSNDQSPSTEAASGFIGPLTSVSV